MTKDDFFNELEKNRDSSFDWYLTEDGELRALNREEAQLYPFLHNTYCPITYLCLKKTNRRFDTSDAAVASYLLNLNPVDTKEIIQAADNSSVYAKPEDLKETRQTLENLLLPPEMRRAS